MTEQAREWIMNTAFEKLNDAMYAIADNELTAKDERAKVMVICDLIIDCKVKIYKVLNDKEKENEEK